MNRKKYIRWALWLVASPFILFFLLCFFIYLPPIQHLLIDKVASYASESAGMRITVGHISLSFPADLVLTDVTAVSQENDTILDVARLQVDVQVLPLFKKHVEIGGVALDKAYLNTLDLIEGVQVKGNIGTLLLSGNGVDLSTNEAQITKVLLEDTDVFLCLNDTTVEDTTSTDVISWKIRVKELDARRLAFRLSMPQDSLAVKSDFPAINVRYGDFDFQHSAYSIAFLGVENSFISYDMGVISSEENTQSFSNKKTLDPLHLSFNQVNIQADSLYYKGNSMKAVINQFAFQERSGFEVVSTMGRLESDDEAIRIPLLKMSTPNSYIEMNGNLDWNVLDGDKDGYLSARLMADIAKPDVVVLMAGLDEKAIQQYPAEPLRIRLGTTGTMKLLRLKTLKIELPSAFSLISEGTLTNVTDSLRRGGEITLRSSFGNTAFLMPLTGGYVIPTGTSVDGDLSLSGSCINTNILLTTLQSEMTSLPDSITKNDSVSVFDNVSIEHTASVVAHYNWRKEDYRADIEVNKLDMHEFMPQDSLFTVSAKLQANGQGVDLFSEKTHFDAKGSVDDLHYGSYILSGIDLSASLNDQLLNAVATVDNDLVSLKANLDGHVKRNNIDATLNVNVDQLDWQGLQLSKIPVSTSHVVGVSFNTDLKKLYVLDASIKKTFIKTPKKTYAAKDLYGGLSISEEYTQAYLRAGDLDMSLLAQGYVENITQAIDELSTEINRQWKQKDIKESEWIPYYPTMYLKLTSGKENPIQNYLMTQGFAFKDLVLNMNTSSVDGLSADGYIHGLSMDSLQIDSIGLKISQDSTGIHLLSNAINSAKKEQDAFDISLKGSLTNNNGNLLVQYQNGKKETGAYIGVTANLEETGIMFQLYPEKPTLVYRPFNLNADNYIFFNENGHISAEVNMHDEQGTGMQFYSNHTDSLAQQDLTVELNRINLQEFRRIIPYMPNMEGWINAAGHYIVKDDNTMISADLMLDDFVYEGNKLGGWEANAVYLPGNANDHHVDGFILHEGVEISHINGIYFDSETGSGMLTADVEMEHFPLYVLNPFIPDNLIEFNGKIDGTLSAKGNPSSPVLNGELKLDSVSMFLPDLSARFTFDNQPVPVTNSQMLLNDFNLYTKGKAPLTVNGSIDMAQLDKVTLDLRMKATNYELINAPKTKRAMTYGKMYVDVTAVLRGPIDELVMRGNMNVLGNSDFTYVMKDSPLTVNDRLGEMVTFVNFNDTTHAESVEMQSSTLTGVDILMMMHIDQAVQAHIDLVEDGSNYMLLEGGGDLSFQYTPEGDMRLNGRYSLISGEMKYEIPVIPLKTFSIQNGSYLEWTGNVMNPTMNITATERVRARVGSDGQSDRMVSFDVGVKLSQTLENLGLDFILSAPEDGNVQNELNAMSSEQQGKLAVTMLVTGTYMSETNTSSSNFNVNNALNSFLQNQISEIVGKSVDVNFGVETLDDDAGRHTDYNFQFARRFWNNRVRVVIGGTVSTGNAATQNESFIDNVSIEYRLDNSGTRYVKLFHEKNYESILEGEVVQTGAGLVLRKKVDRLSDLFIFKKKKEN